MRSGIEVRSQREVRYANTIKILSKTKQPKPEVKSTTLTTDYVDTEALSTRNLVLLTYSTKGQLEGSTKVVESTLKYGKTDLRSMSL